MFPVRFEVFTAVTTKNCVFCDVTTCGYYNNRRFGVTYRLHDQGDRNRWTRNVAVISNLSTLRRNTKILITLMTEALSSSETSFLTRGTWRNIPETPFFLNISVLCPDGFWKQLRLLSCGNMRGGGGIWLGHNANHSPRSSSKRYQWSYALTLTYIHESFNYVRWDFHGSNSEDGRLMRCYAVWLL
jgi:hypothetical protein